LANANTAERPWAHGGLVKTGVERAAQLKPATETRVRERSSRKAVRYDSRRQEGEASAHHWLLFIVAAAPLAIALISALSMVPTGPGWKC
jgi:hypothetical protein